MCVAKTQISLGRCPVSTVHFILICQIDLSLLISWTNPSPNLGVSGVLFHFCFILNRNSCKQTVKTLIRCRRMSDLGLHCLLRSQKRDTRLIWVKKVWILNYPESAQQTLIRLGGCPGWSDSLLGIQVVLLVLSCSGLNGLLLQKSKSLLRIS